MADKKSLPAPIDRPLSRAYLREFTGWSTAYPPGLSDPTSLRLMENIFITREGAAAIRPGLRSVLTKDVFLSKNFGITLVGSFEHFYTNDGRKALLFATRETDNSVFFRAALYNPGTQRFDVKSLTDVGLEFDIPQGQATLSFSAATTYVRYVQIDNKIFAMSNAGEAIRIFWVGNEKKARKIVGLTRPTWSSDDKLTVCHPDAGWINTTAKKTTGLAFETPTTNTLVSSDATKNTYNYGYFYTNDGRKALLFATRETDDSVFFRAALYNPSTKRFDVKSLTDAGLAFDIPGPGHAELQCSHDLRPIRADRQQDLRHVERW